MVFSSHPTPDVTEAALILALAAAAVLIAALLFKSRQKAERQRLRSTHVNRAAGRTKTAAYTEAETMIIEAPRKQLYWLLNSSEQDLYHRLVEAMPNMSIFCQVGVAQLAELRGRQAVSEISDMIGECVDFLVCRDDFSIIAAIELKWPAGSSAVLQRAEEAKRLALESLGIPLIVFRPNQLPDVDRIALEIAGAILRRNQLEAKRDQRLRA